LYIFDIGMTLRENIHREIDYELDRIDFERTFKQNHGRVVIEVIYEPNNVKLIFKDREVSKSFK
jgi:hypothetical protein